MQVRMEVRYCPIWILPKYGHINIVNTQTESAWGPCSYFVIILRSFKYMDYSFDISAVLFIVFVSFWRENVTDSHLY